MPQSKQGRPIDELTGNNSRRRSADYLRPSSRDERQSGSGAKVAEDFHSEVLALARFSGYGNRRSVQLSKAGSVEGSPLSKGSGGLFPERGLLNLGRCSRPLPGRISGAAALTLLLALTGCATTQYKYIPTYCVTRAQLDQLKKEQPGKVHDQLTGDASKDVGILAGSAIRLRAYSDGLLEVLGGCVDPNAGAVAK